MDGAIQAPNLVLIATLIMHPDQGLYEGTLAEADEHVLREDLRTNGQRDPIKILANGTILDGHQRVRLLQELGHTEVLAIVVELTGDEFEQRAAFLKHNMSRRQLSPLQHARLQLHLYEAERGWGIGEATDPRRWREVKDAIRHRLTGSERHVTRLLRVILLPPPVVTAVEKGRLGMILAEKLDKLEADELAAVVEEIEQALADDTADINAIVKAYMPEARTRCNPGRDFEILCSALQSFADKHGESIQKMTARRFVAFFSRLENGKALLDRLIAQLETIDPDADPFADLADLLEGDDD